MKPFFQIWNKNIVAVYVAIYVSITLALVILAHSWLGVVYSLGLLLFIIPGVSLSFALVGNKRLSQIERMLLALALSLATIPTSSFILSKYGTPITLTSTVIVIIAVSALGLLGTFLRLKFIQKKAA